MKTSPIFIFIILVLAVTACAPTVGQPATQTTVAEVGSTVDAETSVPSVTAETANEPSETVSVESTPETPSGLTYPIVDTGQTTCYDDRSTMTCPQSGGPFYGQDAQIEGLQPAYQNNGDGTVTDLNTGLMWTASPDLNGDGVIDINDKLNYEDALASAEDFSLAGYDDWRLPTIKELYSLIQFTGTDPSAVTGNDTSGLTPFIDTEYFEFAYGDTNAGERIIDSTDGDQHALHQHHHERQYDHVRCELR